MGAAIARRTVIYIANAISRLQPSPGVGQQQIGGSTA